MDAGVGCGKWGQVKASGTADGYRLTRAQGRLATIGRNRSQNTLGEEAIDREAFGEE